MSDVRLFIGGKWRESSHRRTGDVINPATEEVVNRFAFASAEDVNDAIDAADTALPGWRRTTPSERAALLERAATALVARGEVAAAALTSEQGKPLAESRNEIARAVETFSWHGREAHRCAAPRVLDGGVSVMPEPIGVVAAFTPWNYPAVIIARKISAALSAGCTVVLKAAEETPGIAAHVVAALEEAGLPAGVVNLVFGDPASISSQLIDAPVVRALSFTGSTPVGKQLAARAARNLTRCVLELGGHAPVLVFDDADLDAAVEMIAAYKFECAGQSCNAPSRVYVHDAIHAQFVDAMRALVSRLRVGDGAHAQTDMGPMANARRLEAMQRLTADARAQGANVLTGGERLSRPGYFWPPTLMTEVPDSAAVVTEEPFGPILPISRFSSFDEAIERANASTYGLAAYVFTRSTATASAAIEALAVGSVGVNELRGVPPDVGIAGIKDSGYGYEGGALGVEAFLNLKVVRGMGAPAMM